MTKQIGRFNVTVYPDGAMQHGQWLALIVIDEFSSNDKPLGHRAYYGRGESKFDWENYALIKRTLSKEARVAELYALPENKIVDFVDIGVVMVA